MARFDAVHSNTNILLGGYTSGFKDLPTDTFPGLI
jgi:hypothetical protein